MTCSTSRWIVFLLLAAASAAASGCGNPKAKAYTIAVTCSEELRDASVEVDLVGVGGLDRDRWNGYSMTNYFRESNSFRADAEKVMVKFPPGEAGTKQLTATDEMWNRWLKQIQADELYVLAMIPPLDRFSDKSGAMDARRAIIPLRSDRWDVGTIPVEVQLSGVKVMRNPLPVKD